MCLETNPFIPSAGSGLDVCTPVMPAPQGLVWLQEPLSGHHKVADP